MRQGAIFLLLIVSGAVATLIGLIILFIPQALYAGNTIVLTAGAELYSEIRAPGALLTVLGGLILTGALIPARRQASLGLSAALYLSYGTARLWSFHVDGHPGDLLILTMGVELALGLAALSGLVFPGSRLVLKGATS